jgi:hypothetical protein
MRGETFGVATVPQAVLFAVGGHAAIEKRELALASEDRYGSFVKRDANRPRNDVLRGVEISLDVPHDGIEVLALVKEHAVEVGDLILLKLLPAREDELLELAVGRE